MAEAPTEIRMHRGSRTLELTYADGTRHVLPCELLRVFSPSAEVRGHGEGQRQVQAGKKYVSVTAIEPVGNYAIRLTFDDGHATGIYTWDFLDDLARNETRYWEQYEAELERANASRLPQIDIGQWRPQ